jgi:NAD(P)-dependent dehydrogenase (short-subunit alcohol dehydrogenase family)
MGANRGLGLEVVHQLAKQGIRTILGSRDYAKGETVARSLTQGGLAVFPYQLDVTDQHSIDRLLAKESAGNNVVSLNDQTALRVAFSSLIHDKFIP